MGCLAERRGTNPAWFKLHTQSALLHCVCAGAYEQVHGEGTNSYASDEICS